MTISINTEAHHTRHQEAQEWLVRHDLIGKLEPLAGDASFRRYWRFSYESGDKTMILMDAPPAKESITSFITVSNLLRFNRQWRLPKIAYKCDKLGFVIMEDFGDNLLVNQFRDSESSEETLKLILSSLLHVPNHSQQLEDYSNEILQQEMDFFNEWFVKQLCRTTLTKREQEILKGVETHLLRNIAQQRRVIVHRDFHSKNIFWLEKNTSFLSRSGSMSRIGIIDFQDAINGPITYDVVSLLRDLYYEIPDNLLLELLKLHWTELTKVHQKFVNFKRFKKDFDFVTAQRILKVIGIFSRLHFRDQKSQYLDYLPRAMKYLQQAIQNYPELNVLSEIFERLEPLAIKKIEKINPQAWGN